VEQRPCEFIHIWPIASILHNTFVSMKASAGAGDAGAAYRMMR